MGYVREQKVNRILIDDRSAVNIITLKLVKMKSVSNIQ